MPGVVVVGWMMGSWKAEEDLGPLEYGSSLGAHSDPLSAHSDPLGGHLVQ